MARLRSRGSSLCLGELLLWCLLLAVVWKLWLQRLDARDLSFDEVATWYIARRPLSDMLYYLRTAIYEHPPLYYTLAHAWMYIAGGSEFSLRFFSVAIAVLALPLLGWVARQVLIDTGRGLPPAVLLAAMPGFAYYARNARMYSLGVVWIVLSCGLFVRDWLNTQRWPRGPAIVLLAMVHLLALSTHYYLLLPMLVQPLALLVGKRWRPLLVWCVLHAGLAGVGLAWLALAPGLQASSRGFRLIWNMPHLASVAHLLRLLIFSQEVRIPFPVLFSVLGMAGAGVSIAATGRRRIIALWMVGTLVLPLALAYQLPRVPTERYVLFLLPVFALALGFLTTLPLRLSPPLARWGLTLVLGAGLGGLLATNGMSHVINPEEAGYGHTLRQVRACSRPGDGLLFYGPWQWLLFQYYDPGDLPPITLLPPQAPPTLAPDAARPVLEGLLADYDRLWVLPAALDDVDPEHFAEGWLNTHAHAVWRTRDFLLYLPPLPPGTPARSVGTSFGDTLRLERVAWESPSVAAGEPLRFTLNWVCLQPLAGDMRVSAFLKDASGYVWSEAHVIPGEWADPPSRWRREERVTDLQGLMVPPGAPPGEYNVSIVVADDQTKEPLLANGQAEIFLFRITVEEPSVDIASQVAACGLPDPEAVAFCPSDATSCLTLAGHEAPQAVYQGYPLPVTLHWMSSEPLPALSLRLILAPRWDMWGSASVSVTVPLSPGYPPPRWLPGRLVTQKLQLPLPASVPVGSALWRLEVIGPDGTPWKSADGRSAVPLLRLTVKRRPVLRYLPLGVQRARVAFGGEIELRGYRIEGEARPGGTLRLTYIWYTRAQPTRIYAVFNHLMTRDGALVAQVDKWPQEGRMLTTQWRPGEYIEDHYTLVIPADSPSGPYRFSTGMYDAETGERLPAVESGQRLPDDRLYLPLPGQTTP